MRGCISSKSPAAFLAESKIGDAIDSPPSKFFLAVAYCPELN
jgi:hypothetical protein